MGYGDAGLFILSCVFLESVIPSQLLVLITQK